MAIDPKSQKIDDKKSALKFADCNKPFAVLLNETVL